jgi:hypothetical protein
MEEFTYEALPSDEYIRIIELLPGGTDDVIRCNLTVELRHHTQGPYDAISYVWGDAKDAQEIICCQKSMRITNNLADALRTIRKKNPGRSTRLWADAISINQEFTEEKNDQVKNMGLVYGNSTQVHIWLGPDREGVAKDLFELIPRWIQLLGDYREPSKVPHTIAASRLCQDMNRGSKLANLLNLAWFSRVWVVQEVALAERHHLHWGDASLDFADLIELACFCDGNSNIVHLIGGDDTRLAFLRLLFRCVYRPYGKTKSWGTNKSYYLQRLSKQHSLGSGLFLDILLAGKSLNASKAQDHIYSFLGNPLALDDNGKMIVEPDYRKDEGQVNLELADALLKSRESPFVLCFVQHCSAAEITGSKGPSWVPKWKNETRDRKAAYTIGNIGLGQIAGGSADKLHYRIEDSKILVLQGLISDELCWTSDLLKSENFAIDQRRLDDNLPTSQKPYVELLWDKVSIAFEQRLEPVQRPTRTRYEEDFSFTLVAGYKNPREIKSKEHRGNFRAYCQILQRKRDGQFAHGENIMSKTKDESAARFEKETRSCSQRRFGITKSGGFALVPEFAQAGDVCAFFLGMATPFLLRPAEVRMYGEGYYHLVGEVYIHGTMRGELGGQLDDSKMEIMLI